MSKIIEIIKGIITMNPDFLRWYIGQGRVVLDFLHCIFDGVFYTFLYMAVIFTGIFLILSLVVIFSKKKSQEKEFIAEKAPFVTIQIPTRNELVALRCAEKCLEFDYPKDRYEILIGDDSDNPEISQKLAEFDEVIMHQIAYLLPPEHRGPYQNAEEVVEAWSRTSNTKT